MTFFGAFAWLFSNNTPQITGFNKVSCSQGNSLQLSFASSTVVGILVASTSALIFEVRRCPARCQ